jgi:NitT/TauT family transport system ATP-binding protein
LAAPKILLRDLELSYQNKTRDELVFGPMSVEIPPGQTVALVGPSGCGKSSLLKAIIGDLEPSSGTIGFESGSATKTKLSVVFQQNTVFPWLTAQENVAYPLRLSGLSKRERDDKATDWLSRVGLRDSIDKYPAELSGGMLQRVALARALAHEPDLLVLDEPFGQIDELTRLDLGLLLQGLLAETNITTLFVTHSIDEAVLISSRIFVFSKGPARLLLDVPNPLGVSRQSTTVTEKTFIDLRNTVMQTLIQDRPSL